MALSSSRNLQRVPRKVCADLRLKLGELRMAVEIACFVISNFETLAMLLSKSYSVIIYIHFYV